LLFRMHPGSTKKRDRCVWHWQRSLNDTAECLGTVGTGTARQLVRARIATPARPDCVADHTCDDVRVILSSNRSTAVPVSTASKS
jgi:hypothetical protein